jgi:hypothetical protein
VREREPFELGILNITFAASLTVFAKLMAAFVDVPLMAEIFAAILTELLTGSVAFCLKMPPAVILAPGLTVKIPALLIVMAPAVKAALVASVTSFAVMFTVPSAVPLPTVPLKVTFPVPAVMVRVRDAAFITGPSVMSPPLVDSIVFAASSTLKGAVAVTPLVKVLVAVPSNVSIPVLLKIVVLVMST